MERPVSGGDKYLEWQERLKRFEASGLSIDAFCQQEDVGRSRFMDWLRVLKREPRQTAGKEGESRIRGKTRVRTSDGEGELDRDLITWWRDRTAGGKHRPSAADGHHP